MIHWKNTTRAAALLLASLGASSAATEPRDTRLLDAVKDRNTALVKTLLAEHVDVNAAQPDGATPLAWAAFLDDTEMLDLLLKAGARVDTHDEYGETPLTLAAANGNTALVQKLLEKGADARAARLNGETALMLAARTGNIEVVKLLLDKGANVEAIESHRGQNALMWAAAHGRADVVKLLLDRGAKAGATSKGGFTPLIFAARNGSAGVISNLLAAGADVNAATPEGDSALGIAIVAKKNAAAVVLLDHGADVNHADQSGLTPLHAASQSGATEVVQKLLAKNANPNALTAKSKGGNEGGFGMRGAGQLTPLHLAAKAHHEDIMRLLAAAGADPKIKADDGTTLLMSAAGSGDINVVRYAYELDAADIGAVTRNGSTVTHAAVYAFQTAKQPEIAQIIEFLGSKGADVDIKDRRGRTPIAIANFIPLETVIESIMKVLSNAGRTPQTPPKR